MAGSNVIKEYLVALGFKTDTASATQANKAIEHQSKLIDDLAKKHVKMFGGSMEAARNKAVEKLRKEDTENLKKELEKREALQRQAIERLDAMAKRVGAKIGLGIVHEGRDIKSFVTDLGHAMTRLAKAGALAAGGLVTSFALITKRLDEVNATAQKTNTTVENIRALDHAFRQLGGTSEDALGALEGVANAMNSNRGVGAMLESWGIHTKDTAKILEEAAPLLRRDPIDIAIKRGSMFGLSPEAVRLIRSGEFPEQMEKARKILHAWGIDQNEVAKSAARVVEEWRELMLNLVGLSSSAMGGALAGGRGFLGQLADTLKELAPRLGPAIREFTQTFATWLSSNSQGIIDWLKDPKSIDNLVNAFSQMKKDAIEFKDAVVEIAKVLKDIYDRFFGSKPLLPLPDLADRDEPGGFAGIMHRFQQFKQLFGFGGGGAEGTSSEGGGVSGRGGGSASSATRASMMKFAMDQLRKEGVPEANLRAAAAHLVGQADMESGLNPRAVHDNGTGYGIYGARLSRRMRMFAWLARNGYSRDSAEGQMRYMAHEAMTSYPETRNILMSADPRTFGNNVPRVTANFESPAVINYRTGAVIQAYRAGAEQASTNIAHAVGSFTGAVRSAVMGTVEAAGRFDVSRFDQVKTMAHNMGAYDFSKANVAGPPVSNDNSRSVNQSNTFNTTINGANGSPRELATTFGRAHEELGGLTIRQLGGVVR